MNKWIGCGRLIKDAELQILKNIQATNVLKYTIAVDRDYKDKDGNKITDFISVEQIGKDYSKLYPHMTKGKQVLIEGQLNIDKSGDKYFTKIKAQKVEFVGGKSESTGNTTPEPKQPEFEAVDDSDVPF